jgi:hypothetical protein
MALTFQLTQCISCGKRWNYYQLKPTGGTAVEYWGCTCPYCNGVGYMIEFLKEIGNE